MPDNEPLTPEQPGLLRFVSSSDYPRLDVCIAAEARIITRSAACRLIRQGNALLDETTTKPSHPVHAGQSIELRLQQTSALPSPEPWKIRTVYEDNEIIVVDKPAGLVVHPAPGHTSNTLVNMLLSLYSELPGDDAIRPGIVHRLDKDTSGLLIVAKTAEAHEWLVSQFKGSGIRKTYLALVLGKPKPSGIIEQPLGRHPVHRKQMAVVEGGRSACTSYTVCEYLGSFSLIAARPVTGRTHQIRVHLAHIGHPIAGDTMYGGRAARYALRGILKRQFLHAYRLVFSPPWRDSQLELISPLPDELQQALEYARHLSE